MEIPVTFEDVSGAVSDITGSLSSVYGAASSVGEAFEKLADDSTNAWEMVGAGVQILTGLAQMMQTICSISEMTAAAENTVTAAKLTGAEVSMTAASTQAGAETALAAADTVVTEVMLDNAKKRAAAGLGVAASEAASSVAATPWVGPVLAAAAFASMLALMTRLPKFSTGGVFGGNAHGDMNLARVNGGEMILNRNQQARLFNILDGKSGTGAGKNEIIFKIDGTTLKGVMRNIDGKQKPIGNE